MARSAGIRTVFTVGEARADPYGFYGFQVHGLRQITVLGYCSDWESPTVVSAPSLFFPALLSNFVVARLLRVEVWRRWGTAYGAKC